MFYDDDIDQRSNSFFNELDRSEILDQAHEIGQGLNYSGSAMQDVLPRGTDDKAEASYYGI